MEKWKVMGKEALLAHEVNKEKKKLSKREVS